MSFRRGQHIGPYVVEKPLGAGGMASVWLARDERRNQPVAIKVMTEPMQQESQVAARFMDEIRHHAVLRHPNIVAVRDVFSVAGQPCLVMDVAPGGSLAALLQASPGRRLPVASAMPLIKDVLAALDYAHRQGMVHRDVKPSNVLLDANHGQAYLADFGIALAAGERRRTRAGQSIGTTAYMSPEQIRATGTIDYRSDVYSVGCVLYEILTGRPPFVAEGSQNASDDTARAAVFAMHLRDKPVAPHRRLHTIPRHVSELILRTLEKDPARRVTGCAEFSRLLSEPAALSSRLTQWLRTPTGLVAAIAVAAALGAGAMLVLGN
jgi:serine/threonine protein kinase